MQRKTPLSSFFHDTQVRRYISRQSGMDRDTHADKMVTQESTSLSDDAVTPQQEQATIEIA